MSMDINSIAGVQAAPSQPQQSAVQPSANAQAAAAAFAAQSAVSFHSTQVAIEGGDGEKDRSGLSMSEKINAAIADANSKATSGRTTAQFKYHEKTKRISIKIMDRDTKEVIREIPPEETLDMISKFWEIAGLMVDVRK